ncbi:11022_t:CDS:2, partial [Scutellospora calospora]
GEPSSFSIVCLASSNNISSYQTQKYEKYNVTKDPEKFQKD